MSDKPEVIEQPSIEEMETVKIRASVPTLAVVRYLMGLQQALSNLNLSIENQISALTTEIDTDGN